MGSSEDSSEMCPRNAARERIVAHAQAMWAQAPKGGQSFEVYPPDVAEGLLGLLEGREFADPQRSPSCNRRRSCSPIRIERAELFRRMLQEAVDDPEPGIPAQEMCSRLGQEQPLPPAAKWE
jgi:hypothetical protein